MRPIPAILVLLGAAVLSLPPGWCRAPGDSPACCDACHDEQEPGGDADTSTQCPCHTLALKQAEEAPACPLCDAWLAVLTLERPATEALPLEPDDRKPPNYQRTLCRWR